MDYAAARTNMVEQQIRPWEVLERRMLDVCAAVPRECFVSPEQRSLAYADVALGLPCGHHMLNPKIAARMVTALGDVRGCRVLQVGVGSGYVTALLGRLGAQVTGVELFEPLTEFAARNLAAADCEAGITLHTGAAQAGWPGDYAAIVLCGSLPGIGEAWPKQIAEDTLLVGIFGQAPAMQVIRYRRNEDGSLASESLFETVVDRLQKAPEPAEFVF